MIPTGQLTAFLAMVVVVTVIPGPSVLFTVGRALTVGRRDALLTVVGNSAGVYVQVAAVALGIGAIVAQSAAAFTVIKFAGAAYLVHLGIQAVRRRGEHTVTSTPPVAAMPAVRVLRQGFTVGVTNPKMIVFLTAVLPQFADPVAGSPMRQMLLLGLLVVVVTTVCDSGWALLAGAAKSWFASSPRRLEAVGGAGGIAMVGVGVSLAVTGRPD